MSGKQTYQQEEQIRRYLQDQMTEAERHAFEREMQRDSFLTEAVEGFSASDADLVFADLTNLRAQLEKPKKNRRFIWYAAASVLLLIVSSVVLFNWQENVIPVVTENVIRKEAKPKGIRIEETTSTKFTSPTVVPKENKHEEVVADSESINEMVATETEMESVSGISLAVTDSTSKNMSETTESHIVAEETNQLADSNAKTSNPRISYLNTSATQNKDVKPMFAKKKSELNEVVVVGYGTKQKSAITGSISSVASKQIIDGKASPLGGWKAFDEYLKVQLLAPKIGKPGKKTIVRLSFVITETGEKVDYEILKGEDETYNKEAIRIINEGPAWVPEISEKTPQKSVVKLKLVFEP